MMPVGRYRTIPPIECCQRNVLLAVCLIVVTSVSSARNAMADEIHFGRDVLPLSALFIFVTETGIIIVTFVKVSPQCAAKQTSLVLR